MKQRIIEAIQQYNTIIIHRHVRPDPDAYGSQGGLANIIQTSFPEKKVYVAGKRDKSLDYLFVPDQVSDDLYNGALVIVCDTANQERICGGGYKRGEKIIKIDHHPNHDPYGDLVWVDTTVSSTSEMIYDLYLEGQKHGWTMSDESARLIYAGIVGDTGRFLFPSTSTKTFEYVSQLVTYQFDRTILYNDMYEIEPHVVKLQGYVLEHFEMTEAGAAFIELKKSILQQFGVHHSEASILVGSLGNVKGIKAWCFFVEEDDLIRVRIRSKGPVINTIAQKYNGGGHPLASGATIYSWDEAEKVKRDIIEVCR